MARGAINLGTKVWIDQSDKSLLCSNYDKYHASSGLMQILHFDWLQYYKSINNSHQVAKFAGFVNLFISFYSQINIFFFLILLLLFSVRLVV